MIDKDGKKQIMPEPIASSYDYKCHTGMIKFKVNMEQFSLENEPFVDNFKAYLKGTIQILRHHFQGSKTPRNVRKPTNIQKCPKLDIIKKKWFKNLERFRSFLT